MHVFRCGLCAHVARPVPLSNSGAMRRARVCDSYIEYWVLWYCIVDDVNEYDGYGTFCCADNDIEDVAYDDGYDDDNCGCCDDTILRAPLVLLVVLVIVVMM